MRSVDAASGGCYKGEIEFIDATLCHEAGDAHDPIC